MGKSTMSRPRRLNQSTPSGYKSTMSAGSPLNEIEEELDIPELDEEPKKAKEVKEAEEIAPLKETEEPTKEEVEEVKEVIEDLKSEKGDDTEEKPMEFKCEICGKICKSLAGLKAHQRKAHQE